MKQINVDRQEKRVKNFVRALSLEAEGSVLKLRGKPVLRVLPVGEQAVDRRKLRAAILKRRDASRRLNEEWEAVDREAWERLPGCSE